MKPRAPFYLKGEAGRALDENPRLLGDLGIINPLLKIRSLDMDELTFGIRDNGTRLAIPDDEQWVTLMDDSGETIFTGIVKRAFLYPQRVYGFRCSNVYKALSETPFLSDGRAFIVYGEGNVMLRLRDILLQAQAAGLPIQPPAIDDLPPGFLVPKQAFRSATYSSALEDATKWVPDLVTRMDYSTSPPTLRFYCRISEDEMLINLYDAQNKTSEVELESWPEARALAISFAYARRDGDDVVQYLVQSAGDDNAEARRKISLFLSGQERTDLLISEALTTAQKAVAVAEAAVTAVGADIDAAAASAQIQITWASLYPRDSTLVAAVAAQPGYGMGSGGVTYTLYTGIGCGGGSPWVGSSSMPTTALALRNANDSLATGWYPIESGAFSDAELATAGATKETKYIKGEFVTGLASGSAGANYLKTNAAGKVARLPGYTINYTSNCANTSDYYKEYLSYDYNISVDAINMAPTAVAAAVKAAAAAGSSAFIQRAEFVEAPPDLAKNYFERQDWTPFKGRLSYTPSGSDIPVPGSFISIIGEATPPEWKNMKVPISELALDLQTQIARLTVGPSPRQNFNSLIDRLRIPPEDNTEAG